MSEPTPQSQYPATAESNAPAPAHSGTNTLAIIALVLAIFIPLAGLICGIIARKQARERGQKGEGLAKAAIIVSVVVMVLSAIALL